MLKNYLRIWPVPSTACWEKSKYGKRANIAPNVYSYGPETKCIREN